MNSAFSYVNMSRDVSVLFKEKRMENGIDTVIYHCDQCGHYQIPSFVAATYYDDYLMTATSTKSINDLMDGQLRHIKELYPDSKSLLEVGCGDGTFLEKAEKLFDDCLGVDPSQAFIDECKTKQVKVIRAYFNKKLHLKKKFDVIVSRQCFEHLDNPLEVFTAMVDHLNEGGLILIDVPNGGKTMRENRFYDVFSDHVNHFTIQSLTYLAEHNKMYVQDIHESFGGGTIYHCMQERYCQMLSGCNKKSQKKELFWKTF